MSFTRRSWIAAMLAAAFASLTGRGRAAAAPAPALPRRRARPGTAGYKTRWIGHY